MASKRVKTRKQGRSEIAEINSLKVIKHLRGGLYGSSLNKISKLVGVSPHTVVKYANDALYKKNGRYVVKKTDNLQRPPMQFLERGKAEISTIDVTSSRQSTKIGKYFNEVKRVLNGEYNEIFKFKNSYIMDDNGQRHYFETNPKQVIEMWSAVPQTEMFQVYKK